MDFAFRVPAYAGQAEPPRSASRSPRPATARLHVLIQVSLKKIVQEGANESDGGKLANIAPGRSDRTSDDIRGQFEFEPQKQPYAKAHPDFFPLPLYGSPSNDRHHGNHRSLRRRHTQSGLSRPLLRRAQPFRLLL